MNQIIFKTNIDAYQRVIWFYQLHFIPRKGEYVYVPADYQTYCESHHIPNRLEVTSVSYYMNKVEIELWFSQDDFNTYNSEIMREKYGSLVNR